VPHKGLHAPGARAGRAAAARVAPHVGTIARAVLDYLRGRGETGATCDEVEVDLGHSGNTIRPRLVAFRRDGLVVKTTAMRRTLSGCQAAVYRAAGGTP
jgi:hypothetical protein